jgi:hypothetical protein
MRYRGSRAPGLLISVLASLLVPAFLVAAEDAPAARLGVSDSPPVVPVLSPPLKDTPPLLGGNTDQRHVINLELPHPGAKTDQPVRPDGALQTRFGITAPDPTGTNFDGLGANGGAPPDNDGKVGPNHYIQWINTQFAVYDKTGTKLYGPANGNTLFTALGSSNPCVTHNDGDPIVEYDLLADRWVLTQFVVGSSPNFSHQCVAISQTGDPLGSYYLYDFVTDSVNFVDYPHWGVWPDSYYMTAHIFNAAGTTYLGQGLYVFERPKMLAGLPARVQGANVGAGTFGGALPSDLDSLTPPPPGSPNYMIAPGSPELDGTVGTVLHIWKASATWGVTPTFTITGPTDVATAAFRADICGFSRNCVPQSGTTTTLDAISDRLLWRLAYRNFGGTESLVLNHTVDVMTPPSNQAGVRWYEVRSPGSSPTIFQQGTLAPDSLYRWMGSIAMDNSGDIALGYSKSSSGIFPEIDITGRLPSDPLGTMGAEIVMKAGLGSQTGGLNRWGDYTAMSVDPRDGCTFWYTNQYQPANGSFNWSTRIASFRFPSCVSPLRGTIQGFVTDAVTGLPIPGALVSTDTGFSGATDVSGRYSIVLPPGSYTVTGTSALHNCNPSASQPATVVNGGVTTLNFTLTGTALISQGPIGIDDSIGNNNGAINRNECVKLNLPLKNTGCAAATGVSAVLSTSTAGVTVTQPNSTYPNMPTGGTSLNAASFQIATSPSFVCGTTINFTLTVTSSAGTTMLPFSLPSCQATASFSGSISGTDPTQTGRVVRNGVPGACPSKAYPGLNDSNPRHDKIHTFTNTFTSALCVTVTTTTACTGANFIFPVAYLGAFNPANIATNYLSDPGASPNPSNSFSATIPAGGTINLVVNEVTVNAGCPAYSILVTGLIDNSNAGRPAAPTAAGNSPICEGQTLNLTASTVPGATYLWTGPNGFTSTQQNPSIPNVTTAAAGTYTVVATIGGCNSDPATTSVTVNLRPSATIAAPAAVCSTSPSNTASVPDAGPGATYVWTILDGTINSGQGTNSITFTPTGTSPVTLGVTVTNSSNCSNVGSATVFVNTTSCGSFFTLTPCRVIDTRTTNVPSLAAGGSRTFILSGTCAIPSTALAISANVAVTGETSSGNLQVFPGGFPVPQTAVINYNTGQTRANNAIIPLGPGGTITVKCNQGLGTTDFILDVNGYFQ